MLPPERAFWPLWPLPLVFAVAGAFAAAEALHAMREPRTRPQLCSRNHDWPRTSRRLPSIARSIRARANSAHFQNFIAPPQARNASIVALTTLA
jgi:hypothetical protein